MDSIDATQEIMENQQDDTIEVQNPDNVVMDSPKIDHENELDTTSNSVPLSPPADSVPQEVTKTETNEVAEHETLEMNVSPCDNVIIKNDTNELVNSTNTSPNKSLSSLEIIKTEYNSSEPTLVVVKSKTCLDDEQATKVSSEKEENEESRNVEESSIVKDQEIIEDTYIEFTNPTTDESMVDHVIITEPCKKNNSKSMDTSSDMEVIMELQENGETVKTNDTPEENISKSTEEVPSKRKSVIQDIFDDWGVDHQPTSPTRGNDSVENELQNLLDDGKTNQHKKTKTHENGESKDENPTTENADEKSKPSTPVNTSVTKNRRLMLNQIVSPAEVKEVLKERFREKQKFDENPRKADIFFVKKITQRLSNKLSGGSLNTSGLVPLSTGNRSTPPVEDENLEADNKTENPDNKELLAILEGDVDPDWSNLKSSASSSTAIPEEKKSIQVSENNTLQTKLDPLLERELALKQLLELPLMPAIKSSSSNKNKKTFKPASKTKEQDPLDKEEEDSTESNDLSSSNQEKDQSNESRSGRKRKLTEKAREQEENATKRQRVYKGKVDGTEEINESLPIVDKSVANKIERPTRKSIVGKKLLRSNKKTTRNLKKVMKKTTPRVSKLKRSTENVTAEMKPKKKIVNEIDRLLQDEGVVNLLYDVEQPDKRRLIPVTKSQAKVMDIDKVQRELKIRKKMVRNAVLRLHNSTQDANKNSQRAKRMSVLINEARYDRKTDEPSTAPKFIYPAKIRNAADASIIIRRHSSSSFSSTSGSPRVSVDTPDKDEDKNSPRSQRILNRKYRQNLNKKLIRRVVAAGDIEKTVTKKKHFKEIKETNSNDNKVVTRSNGVGNKNMKIKNDKPTRNKVTFAKVQNQEDSEKSLLLEEGDDQLSVCLAEAATALSTSNSRKTKANESKITTRRMSVDAKEINVCRHGHLVQLILPSPTNKKNSLTLEVIREFCDILSALKKDKECRVVLVTSIGSSFCEGIDLSTLLQSNLEERRQRAQEMANGVKDFIKSLANFDKPIVAGVQGTAVGLGVTMLPLFDLVIASDKATFVTPYGKLGQIAEGAAIFVLSHIAGYTVTNELLLGGRTMTASEALRAGLVTRVLWPDRFQSELLPSLKAMSEQSSQSMEATKAILRQDLRNKLDAALESEMCILTDHWCSMECQTAIKAYIDDQL